MRTSEYIQDLQKLMGEHGDQEVVGPHGLGCQPPEENDSSIEVGDEPGQR